jgi:hypothetical protein
MDLPVQLPHVHHLALQPELPETVLLLVLVKKLDKVRVYLLELCNRTQLLQEQLMVDRIDNDGSGG